MALGIFSVVLREHWNKTKEHDQRISSLERSVATKSDITALHERMTEIGDQMNEQHATILKTLLQRSGGR